MKFEQLSEDTNSGGLATDALQPATPLCPNTDVWICISPKMVHYRRPLNFDFEGSKAMTTSPSLIQAPAPRHTTARVNLKKAEDLESIAQLVEDLIPNFKKEEEKQFYNEVAQSYRAAARDILRRAWSEDKGQDIAEYAVMLAVILVLVVGTIRLVGSNANTVFSQAASSIQ
jgi:Flp pilus assembly pilin Flp